jgi:hypothetical protein
MWTRFMDMHSGGGCKEKPYEYIYIEAGETEAKTIFYNRFGHNPERVTCTCCGEDYSTSEYKTLEEATQYQRENRELVGDYCKRKDVLVIRAKEIKPEEYSGSVPRQGYVWVDA